LKSALAAGGLTVAGIIGLEYLLPEKMQQVQPSYTSGALSRLISTLTESSSTQLSSTQLYTLQGQLFFDYKGNGIQDVGEPSVQNAKVQIKNYLNTQVIVEAFTDSSGKYKIDLPAGNYRFFVQPDLTKPSNPKLGYMCRSLDEFRSINDGYEINVTGPGTFDVGLMEGFLTLPFTNPNALNAATTYVDLDPMSATPRDWMNERELTWHQALGTDFRMPIGNDLVAAAPGVVVDAIGTWPNVPTNPNWGYVDSGNQVTIDHGIISTFTTGNNASRLTDVNDFLTNYCHMDSVSVYIGQQVKRGDFIGKSGQTGRLEEILAGGPVPQVHFQAGGFALTRADPFRDITGIADHITYWTKDNDPRIFNLDYEIDWHGEDGRLF
jgi:hypothetical protein